MKRIFIFCFVIVLASLVVSGFLFKPFSYSVKKTGDSIYTPKESLVDSLQERKPLSGEEIDRLLATITNASTTVERLTIVKNIVSYNNLVQNQVLYDRLVQLPIFSVYIHNEKTVIEKLYAIMQGLSEKTGFTGYDYLIAQKGLDVLHNRVMETKVGDVVPDAAPMIRAIEKKTITAERFADSLSLLGTEKAQKEAFNIYVNTALVQSSIISTGLATSTENTSLKKAYLLSKNMPKSFLAHVLFQDMRTQLQTKKSVDVDTLQKAGTLFSDMSVYSDAEGKMLYDHVFRDSSNKDLMDMIAAKSPEFSLFRKTHNW